MGVFTCGNGQKASKLTGVILAKMLMLLFWGRGTLFGSQPASETGKTDVVLEACMLKADS